MTAPTPDPIREAVATAYHAWCRDHGYDFAEMDAEDDGLVDRIVSALPAVQALLDLAEAAEQERWWEGKLEEVRAAHAIGSPERLSFDYAGVHHARDNRRAAVDHYREVKG